jgi:hypothetical protein
MVELRWTQSATFVPMPMTTDANAGAAR